jgi:hypothetical protein
MLFCQFTQTVWCEVKKVIPLHLKRKDFSSPKDWLFDFLARASDLQATTLSVAFYLIWEARNEVRNSEVKPDPNRTAGKIVDFVDFIKQNLYKTNSAQRCASIPSISSWTPPPLGTVLINSDAAIFQAQWSIGAGAIA